MKWIIIPSGWLFFSACVSMFLALMVAACWEGFGWLVDKLVNKRFDRCHSRINELLDRVRELERAP